MQTKDGFRNRHCFTLNPVFANRIMKNCSDYSQVCASIDVDEPLRLANVRSSVIIISLDIITRTPARGSGMCS